MCNGDRVRSRVGHTMDIMDLGIVGIHYMTYFEGDEASAMRSRLDLDADGTVDVEEVEAELDALEDRHGAVLGTSDMTLDGDRADEVGFSIAINFAEGPVDSTETILLRLHKSVSWDFVEPRDFHVYGLGSEAVGGDEPWENTPEAVLTIKTPLNWEFDVHDLPQGVEDLVQEGRQELIVTGEDWTDWNSTMGQVETITIERKSGGEGGGGLVPGFIAAPALAAVVAATSIQLARGRSQGRRRGQHPRV